MIANSTSPAANNGIGSCMGIADQLSLPNIACPDVGLRGFGSDVWARPRRNPLGRNRLEQPRIIKPITRLAAGERLLRELLVAVRVQHLPTAGRACDPIGKRKLRYHVNVEQHVGKAIT